MSLCLANEMAGNGPAPGFVLTARIGLPRRVVPRSHSLRPLEDCGFFIGRSEEGEGDEPCGEVYKKEAT